MTSVVFFFEAKFFTFYLPLCVSLSSCLSIFAFSLFSFYSFLICTRLLSAPFRFLSLCSSFVIFLCFPFFLSLYFHFFFSIRFSFFLFPFSLFSLLFFSCLFPSLLFSIICLSSILLSHLHHCVPYSQFFSRFGYKLRQHATCKVIDYVEQRICIKFHGMFEE